MTYVKSHFINTLNVIVPIVMFLYLKCYSPVSFKVAVTRAILFNKRRGGEACRIFVSDYKDRPSWRSAAIQEVTESLKSVEQELCKR